MTDRQEEIFRDYGLTDEEIEEMKEDGLDIREEAFANTAIIMLDHLKEKYNQEFMIASGGGLPDLFSSDYWINAQACEGDYAGIPFEVSLDGEDIQDGYISILKNDEACNALSDFIHKKNSDVKVYADIDGKYGTEEVTIDMTGDELMHAVDYSAIMVITAPEMSESDFQSEIEEIESYLEDNEIRVGGNTYCFYEKVDPEMSESQLMEKLQSSTKDNEIYKCTHYLSSY